MRRPHGGRTYGWTACLTMRLSTRPLSLRSLCEPLPLPFACMSNRQAPEAPLSTLTPFLARSQMGEGLGGCGSFCNAFTGPKSKMLIIANNNHEPGVTYTIYQYTSEIYLNTSFQDSYLYVHNFSDTLTKCPRHTQP
jgi:hypothetical protein